MFSTSQIIVAALFLCATAVLGNSLKYPWLTQSLNDRPSRLAKFAPDDYSFNSGSYLTPDYEHSPSTNDIYGDNTPNEIPRINYPMLIKKYWALLNPGAQFSKQMKRNYPWANLGNLLDNGDSNIEYAQLGVPEYVLDEPAFDLTKLRKQTEWK